MEFAGKSHFLNFMLRAVNAGTLHVSHNT